MTLNITKNKCSALWSVCTVTLEQLWIQGRLDTVSSHHHKNWREIVFHTHARIPGALGKDFVAKLAKITWKNTTLHGWLALEHMTVESRRGILWKQMSLNCIENYWFSWSEVNEVCLSFSSPALGRIMKLPEDRDHSIKINRWVKHIRIDFYQFLGHFTILGFWRSVWRDVFWNAWHLSVCFLYIYMSLWCLGDRNAP